MIGDHNVNYISTYTVIFSYSELMTIHRVLNEKYSKMYKEREEKRKSGEIIEEDPYIKFSDLEKVHDELGDVFVEDDTS